MQRKKPLRNALPKIVVLSVYGLGLLERGTVPELRLDQVNIGALPRNLAGRGEVDLVLMVDGKAANTVRVTIK